MASHRDPESRGRDPRSRNGERSGRRREGGDRNRRERHRAPFQGTLQRIRQRARRSESEISCCVKYMVFGFNVLFWIIGLAIFLVGVWAKLDKTVFNQLADIGKIYLDPAWILIIVGCVTFIIGFSGCVGALRENTCLLSFYAGLLGVLLLTQLTFAILGFVFKDGLRDLLSDELDNMIILYRDDPDLQSVIDWIQKDWLQCCGVTTPDDWEKNLYFNTSSEALGSPEAGGVPFSCCRNSGLEEVGVIPNLYCGHGVRKKDYTGKSDYFKVGCLEKFTYWLNRNVMSVGVALVIIAVLEILGICFAMNLRSDVFAQKARWYYEH